MQVDRLCKSLARQWLLICGLLGMTSYYYSTKRHQLVRSTWLRIHSGLALLFSLGGFYFYFNHGQKYFVPSYFRHFELLSVMCTINMSLHLVVIVIQSAQRLTNEKEICRLCNQLMSLCRLWKLKHSFNSTCKVLLLAKAFTYVHQITSPLVGILIVIESRRLTPMDIYCNLYYVYNFNVMFSHMLAYMLILLQLAETMRLNAADGNLQFWTKLCRQAKLSHMTRRIHQLFALEIVVVLLAHLFFNTCTFYLAYMITRDGQYWTIKVQLTIFSFLIKLLDILLVQLVCEYLLAEEKQLFRQLNSLQFQIDAQECQMAQLMHATVSSKCPPKHVLGMFSLDKRCAFNIISSSLGYAIIIMQIGYIYQQK
ncbi:putative gustatory receptor 10b [Drosophila tropicalis]|uniref:putative gustatory receptor 10b n=1 Tax=Drosophila tropicalis TaxID=46794 RepID=UPI0035AB8A53